MFRYPLVQDVFHSALLPPGGNPACWDGHFTFARCCVAPGEDREVAAYVVQTLAKYERVGLYKDYLPGKDCFWGIYWFRFWISSVLMELSPMSS